MSAWKRIRADRREGDLDGGRSTTPRVDRLLGSARAPGTFRELTHEDEATLHFHRAHLERVHTTREASTMSNPSPRTGLKAAIACAGVVALMSTGASFAASGHAPWSGAAAAGGPTTIPSHSHPTDEPSDGPTDGSSSDPADDSSESAGDAPSVSEDTSAADGVSASPDVHAYPGLCRAYAAGQKAEHGNAWSSPAFAALAAAAGGPDAVTEFCASLPPVPGHPTHPVHPVHPTHPVHPVHPVSPVHPTHPTHPTHTHAGHTHAGPHPAHPSHPSHP
jgi:hypothetical protein